MYKERISIPELYTTEVAVSIQLWSGIAREINIPIYVKGGATRDSLINLTHGANLKVKDLDLVVPGGLFRVVQVAQRHGFELNERGKRKKLPMYHLSGETGLDVDLSYLLSSPNERNVSEIELLRQDAMLSDLDINTISYNLLTGKLNDPLGAIGSIQKKQINLVSERSLFLDPATIFKCFKIASKTGFQISEESIEMIKRNACVVSKLEGWFLERRIHEVLEFMTTDKLLEAFGSLGLIDQRPEIIEYLKTWMVQESQ